MVRAFLPLAIALALTGATSAWGQQNAGNQAAAEALFDQGKALMAAGRYAEACPKFFESNRLDEGIGTSLWLAQCYEKNGQTASAWAKFREAAALATKSGDPREKVARARAQALEAKLARLVLIVPATSKIPGLRLTRDRTDIDSDLWNMPLPTDPGPHTIVARARGRMAETLTITVLPGPGEQALTVPVLAMLPPPPPGVATDTASEASASHAHGGSTQRIAGIATAAAGVVTLGVATYFGLHAKALLNDSNQPGVCGFLPNLPNTCTEAGVHDRSSAESGATASTVLFVVSAAALAGGAALFFTAHTESRDKPRESGGLLDLRAVPWMGAEGAGVVLEAEF
jgi:hypothetical protein